MEVKHGAQKKVRWEFSKDRKIHDESNVWSTSERHKKIYSFDFMLGLNDTIDQLAMANSVRWYGHVLTREDGYIMRKALDFEVEGQRKKQRLKRTWLRQFEKEGMIVGLRRKDALFCLRWSVGINLIAAGLR